MELTYVRGVEKWSVFLDFDCSWRETYVKDYEVHLILFVEVIAPVMDQGI